MANTRYITTAFWEDTKVQEKATPEDRYFMLYLLTNPHTTQVGCYEITNKTIAYETGYNIDTVQRLIERMSKELEFIFYDKKTNEILIKNWYKYNWTASPKVKKFLLKEVTKIKSDFLLEKIENNIGYIYGIDTLSGNKRKENKRKEKENKEEVKEEIEPEEIYSEIENEFGRTLSPIEYETIAQMVSDYPIEFIQLALKEAVLNKALSLKYISKILSNWKKSNLRSTKEVVEYIANFNKQKESGKDNNVEMSYYKNLDD